MSCMNLCALLSCLACSACAVTDGNSATAAVGPLPDRLAAAVGKLVCFDSGLPSPCMSIASLHYTCCTTRNSRMPAGRWLPQLCCLAKLQAVLHQLAFAGLHRCSPGSLSIHSATGLHFRVACTRVTCTPPLTCTPAWAPVARTPSRAPPGPTSRAQEWVTLLSSALASEPSSVVACLPLRLHQMRWW